MMTIHRPGFWRGLAATAMLLLAGVPLLAQQQGSVLNSPHNLSATGPGTVRASSEQQVCIFCHTPHHASDVRPLWNRQLSSAVYTTYKSNSLKATPGQPTGASKLCLSCHDGTIALGDVLSRPGGIAMSGGVTMMPQGASNLGTDLSNDHPISFTYDQTLCQKNPSLKNPSALPPTVKLDSNSELQCTSCHDPHDNTNGKFLVMDNSTSQLCNACHMQGQTTITSHVNCSSCHQAHTAPSGPYLLTGTTVTSTCTTSNCHGTQASQPRLNVLTDINKFSKHDTNSQVNLVNHVPDNTVCSDCHEPHTMGNVDSTGAPAIQPRLGKINGVNYLGSKIPQAQYEYEVCFKCHSDQATTLVTPIARQIVQTNKRMQFSPTAASYHPVEGMGKNSIVPSLKPGLTATSIIYCTDCHASDTSTKAGGTGPNGPHGSGSKPVLIARCDTTDGSIETAATYALCYRCHDRNSIINDRSFTQHRRHVVDNNTPCTVCHDSHGVANGTPSGNAHLINFDISVVKPGPSGQILYQSQGPGAGTCTLTCHNHAHSNTSYGGTSSVLSAPSPTGAASPTTVAPQSSLTPARKGKR